MSYVSADRNPDGTLNLNLCAMMREIGLCSESLNTWAAYPSLTPLCREMLDTVMSPAAYRALHFHRDTFERILSIDQIQFDRLSIFKCFDAGGVRQLESQSSRAPYIGHFEYARETVSRNRLVVGDIHLLENMSFAVSAGMEGDGAAGRLMVKGFYPYFASMIEHLNEYMFMYFHSELDHIAMVTSTVPEYAVQFMLKTGSVQVFDRLCAWCGKTGELLKCPCKVVRYCGRECQTRHWVSHANECRAERARLRILSAAGGPE
jgi:hypothetical protein